MPNETKVTTVQTPRRDAAVTTDAHPGPAENKRDDSGDQDVLVRALKTFHKDGDFKGEMSQPGDEFAVPRQRAAQLRANGLIEYANDTDERRIHGEEGARALSDLAERNAEAGKLPANSKTTPLRNPELKLADAK